MEKEKFKSKIEELDFESLINIIKKKGRKKNDCYYTTDEAYVEIEKRMKVRIEQISYKFFISGFDHNDIYQEALYALRYKAIKDYDKNKGKDKPYPFEKFAILCIRRHLSTQLKSSFQNKKKVLNLSISLDKDRSDHETGDILFLIDILSNGNNNILVNLEEKEYFKILFSKLFKKLSKFEKSVFLLYIHKHSYEDIAKIINKKYRKEKRKTRINVKSIDNAISRIKMKGKEIFQKYGKK